MTRTIPAGIQQQLERTSSPDALIWFLTIRHPNLADPIRLVSDVFDYVLDGNTYTGLVFDAKPVSDTDQSPFTELRVANVDRRIGQALRGATGRAKVAAVARSTADFDLTANPRTAIGTPDVVYSFSQFDLVDVEVNAAEITGRLTLPDYSQEPSPSLRATADMCPGLFW
nr:DUF1833 family protein [uncultured Roseovarius sp.]